MKIRRLILLFIIILNLPKGSVCYGQGYAENNILDSLQKSINQPNINDTTYINLMSEIGEQTPIFRISYWDTIASASEKYLSKYFSEKHQNASTIQALRIKLAGALNNVGYIYINQGNIAKGLEYYHRSLTIQEEIGYKEGIANSLNNIGYIYEDQGDIDKGLEYYHKSLAIDEEIGNKEGVAISLNNIGYVYTNQGDAAKGLEYYQKSLAIQKEIGDKRGRATSLHNIGSIYENQGDVSKGVEYYQKGLAIREEIGDKEGISGSLANLGSLYLQRGRGMIVITMGKEEAMLKARKYGERGLLIAQKLGFPDEIERNSGLLSKVAITEGNYKEALEMRNLEMLMHDSIKNKETEKAAIQQQVKYEQEKAQAIKDKEHEKQMALSIERANKQKMFTAIGIGVSILLIAFLAFVFNRLRITKSQKLVIEQQKQEVENQKTVLETTHQQLAEHHKEITDSITYAERLQKAILPSIEEVSRELKNGFILFQPKDVVSGDFYWIECMPLQREKNIIMSSNQGMIKRSAKIDNEIPQVTNEKMVFFAAADCTGHGVPGAIVSVVCSNALDRAVKEFNLTDTGEILDKTTDLVIERFEKSGEDVKDGMDIALCAIDWNTNILHFSGANNPLWIIRKRTGRETFDEKELYSDTHYFEEHKATKQPIGKYGERKPFASTTIQLQKGDIIYVFTDGFADQFGGLKGKKLKYKPFKKMLLSITEMSMLEQQQVLTKQFNSWKGNLEQVDDVCIIGVRV